MGLEIVEKMDETRKRNQNLHLNSPICTLWSHAVVNKRQTYSTTNLEYSQTQDERMRVSGTNQDRWASFLWGQREASGCCLRPSKFRLVRFLLVLRVLRKFDETSEGIDKLIDTKAGRINLGPISRTVLMFYSCYSANFQHVSNWFVPTNI